MNTLYALSGASVALSLILLIAYLKSGRKDVWKRRCSAISAAIAGILLLAFLGFMPRMAAIRGCTAYVIEGGQFTVESTCKT